MSTEEIHFEKASIKHEEIIFRWLGSPHMQEIEVRPIVKTTILKKFMRS
jgi:hypothetical protein